MSARSELFSGMVILGLTAVSYVEIQRIETDFFSVGIQPATFPETVCLLLGAMTLFMVINAVRKMRQERASDDEATDWQALLERVAPMVAVTIAYVLLIDLIQYVIPTALALSAVLWLFGNRGVRCLITIPTACSVAYYVVFFGIFRLDEPKGKLLEYDNYYLFAGLRDFLGL
ncbi:MAG: tripartite tricarboxylate transporter TctB family protein [Rhodospirillales bacterium]